MAKRKNTTHHGPSQQKRRESAVDRIKPSGEGASALAVPEDSLSRHLWVGAQEKEWFPAEIRYDIRLDARRFGTILAANTAAGHDITGKKCYQAIAGRSQVCPACPAVGGMESGMTRMALIQVGPGRGTITLVLITAKNEKTATISEYRLGTAFFEHFLLARVSRISEQVRLSVREREVFAHLLLGRSYADTAMLLGVSERTVRFHFSNLQRKLGAESRADLLRALLQNG